MRHLRVWLIYLPIALVILCAAGWLAIWYLQASVADKMIAGWREREAREGRTYACGKQTITGFPSRLDIRCTDPTAEFTTTEPPIALRGKEVLVASEMSQPTLLITTFSAPVFISKLHGALSFEGDWRIGQAAVHGTPQAPEGISIEFSDGILERIDTGKRTTALKARRIELHGRIAEGSAAKNPIVDLLLHLEAVSTPEIHPLVVLPSDADINLQIRGLADFEPKQWSQRFREIQERRGSIAIRDARVQQGDLIAAGVGNLGIAPNGELDGEIRVTIVGLEKLLRMLDLDDALQMLNLNGTISRKDIDQTLDVLDQFLPGFGQFARKNAAPSVVAGLGSLGESTTLEGKPAVVVPLRFKDGTVYLGPIPIGAIPRLF
jgi:hypothetical protein